MRSFWLSVRQAVRSLQRVIFQGDELSEPELREVLKLAISVAAGIVLFPLAALLGSSALAPTRRRRQDQWVSIGALQEFGSEPVAVTVQYQSPQDWVSGKQEFVVFVSSSDERVTVLSARCPHLGCSVRWDPDQRLFLCPCHGGVFSPEGNRLAGPPQEGLQIVRERRSGEYIEIEVT